MSDWFDLEAGNKYYIRNFMREWNGNDFSAVGVEFEKSDTEDHHHAMR